MVEVKKDVFVSPCSCSRRFDVGGRGARSLGMRESCEVPEAAAPTFSCLAAQHLSFIDIDIDIFLAGPGHDWQR